MNMRKVAAQSTNDALRREAHRLIAESSVMFDGEEPDRVHELQVMHLSAYNAAKLATPVKDEELWRILEVARANPMLATAPMQKQRIASEVLESKVEVPNPWFTPVPLDPLLSPVAAFKPEFLPDSIRPWVVDVSQRMAVPIDYAAICALSVISGVTGRRVFVYPKRMDKEWKESIALSGAVVASSGKTKTPTWKTFTNVVVEKESDWRREYTIAKEQYDRDHAAWEDKQKRAHKAKEDDLIPDACVGPEPVEPTPARRLMLNDATPEKMHDVMKDNPSGLLYYRDELSSWVAELDKEGREVQRGMFLAAMNGNDPYSIDRIGREGGFAIMCASVFGGFQPELLRDFLNNAKNVDDGTIPRFPLLIWPDEVELPIVDRPANDAAKQQFRRVIRDLSDMQAEQMTIHFNPKAQEIFDAWFVDLSKTISHEEQSGKRSHLSKYKGALPKLAALLQVVDLIGNGQLSGSHMIDEEHIRKAIELLKYLQTHMHRIYGCIQTPVQKAEVEIAKHISKGDLKSGFVSRTIERKNWKNIDSKSYIDLALESLEEKGWVRSSKSAGFGRPTTRWEINPALEKKQ